MTDKHRDELVFIPLGGVGEIGMNMAAYGFGPVTDRKWIVVDCGVSFAGPELPGIELIMPDPSFLEGEGDNVLALVLTHSHEDHYGAVLDLWPDFARPVYCTGFTAAMLDAKRAANEITADLDLRPMRVGKPFAVGPFHIEAINMAHSIPESCALLIDTPAGRLLHTGDWKLDDTPVLGPPTDAARLKRIGEDGKPLALICDSTNAMKEGTSPSEREIGASLQRLIEQAEHRVAVTTFASNLGRVVSIARAAHAAGREVVLAGRALQRVVAIGRELGMLDGVPPFHDQDVFKQLPRSKVVAIITGSQGEARAATARIAADQHPAVSLDPGDTMIFSSWAIPGNERAVIDIQNNFIDRGIKVITNAEERVHVTGHPRRGEMTRLYDWVKPSILVPVHGEAAHLAAHAELGRRHGIETVLEIRNGDEVRLFPDPEAIKHEVLAGELYLDGDVLCTPEESGVRERRRLSFGGMIVVSLCLDRRGEAVAGPELIIEGLPLLAEDEEDGGLARQIFSIVRGTLKSIPAKRRKDAETVAEAIRRAVRAEIADYWGRRPNVRVIVHKI